MIPNLRPLLRIAGAAVTLCIAVGILATILAGRISTTHWLPLLAIVLLVTGALFAASFRMLRMMRRMETFLRQLLSGDYNARISETQGLNDEVARMERALNEFAGQLRIFDDLRKDEVRLSGRVLDVLFSNVEEPILRVDVAKSRVLFNPAACKFLGIEDSSFTLDALSHIKDNEDFFGLLKEVTQASRVPMTGLVLLCLPKHNLKKRVKVEMMPVKDKDETVRTVLIFLEGEKKSAA